MKWIKNSIIPFKGYKAITIWPFVFYRGSIPSMRTINHENIHACQQKEIAVTTFIILVLISLLFGPISWGWWLLVPSMFFIIYILEAMTKGYRNISFEREAFDHDTNLTYRNKGMRKRFGMWRSIRQEVEGYEYENKLEKYRR